MGNILNYLKSYQNRQKLSTGAGGSYAQVMHRLSTDPRGAQHARPRYIEI